MRNAWKLSLFLLVAWFAFAQAAQNTSSKADDEAAVQKLMEEFTTAMDHADVAALDRIWSTDYVWVNIGGRVLTKQQRLDLDRTGKMKTESYAVDEQTIRMYGTTAIVIYRSTVKGQYSGKDVPPQRRVTSVLLKQDGRWQIVSQQSTEIYRPPAAQ